MFYEEFGRGEVLLYLHSHFSRSLLAFSGQIFGTCTEVQDKVPFAKIHEVKGSGHRPHFVGEQAEEINTMILDFLSSADRK